MMKQEDNKIIIYQDDNEVTRVAVRFADEDLWLTQKQLAEIYNTTQQNIAQHIAGIYRDGELEQDRTYKKFLLVRAEGARQFKRNIDHYNLDIIIGGGYCVQSQIATRFRRWATRRLHEDIQHGFAMDDERRATARLTEKPYLVLQLAKMLGNTSNKYSVEGYLHESAYGEVLGHSVGDNAVSKIIQFLRNKRMIVQDDNRKGAPYRFNPDCVW